MKLFEGWGSDWRTEVYSGKLSKSLGSISLSGNNSLSLPLFFTSDELSELANELTKKCSGNLIPDEHSAVSYSELRPHIKDFFPFLNTILRFEDSLIHDSVVSELTSHDQSLKDRVKFNRGKRPFPPPVSVHAVELKYACLTPTKADNALLYFIADILFTFPKRLGERANGGNGELHGVYKSSVMLYVPVYQVHFTGREVL